MMVARETRQLTRKNASLLAHFRVVGGSAFLFLFALSGIAAEVRREQFSKAELDYKGYPTNVTLAADLGRSEARRDLTNGIVRLPAYGLPSTSSFESVGILKEKYHVEMYPIAGCVVTSGLVAYADGYSEVSRKFIELQHGSNLWKNVRAETEKALAERRASSTRTFNAGEYRVRADDTLSRIAREHRVTLKALTEANPNLDPIKLQIGQTIQIPAHSER